MAPRGPGKVQLGRPAKIAKSRQKSKPVPQNRIVKTGRQTAGAVSGGRTGRVRGVESPKFDRYGLETDSKYAGLGDRCRGNIAIAIRDGLTYQGTYGTTEEQVIWGELRRRGFTHPRLSSGRSFGFQEPIAGSVLDFALDVEGTQIALRPQNTYWHGQQTKRYRDDDKARRLIARGWTVADIWSAEALVDATLEAFFDELVG